MKPIYEDFSHVISPITGKIRFEGVQDLTEDYVWIGDANNNPFPSPVIIDVRLDVIELRTILDKLVPSKFILQTKNNILPRAQALDELQNGILKHSKGVIAIAIAGTDYMLPVLSQGKLWIGDDDNKPAEKSRIALENLPSFSNVNPQELLGAYNLYTGSANPTSLGNPTTTLHLQRCNLPDLTVGYIWIGKQVSTFEDPLNFGDNRPTEIKELPLDNMANLSTDKIWVGNENNRPVESDKIPSGGLPDLSTGRFWMGDGNNRPQDTGLLHKNLIIGNEDDQLGFREKIYDENLPDLTIGRFWMGDGNDRPQDTGLSYKNIIIGTQDDQLGFRLTIYIDNLPDLTFKKIWRGDATGRPTESNDLTVLEGKVTNIEDVVIPGIEEEIASIQTEITGIQTEIAGIQGQITIIEGEVSLLQGAVVILQGQVAGLLLSVASLSGRVDTLESKVSTLETNVATLQSQVSVIQGQIVVIQGQIIAINTRIDNLRLNTILADGDVSFYNFKLITLADPLNPQDGVNLRTMQAAISGAVGNISLDGFVLGDSDENGLIHTTRGSLCLLTNIPAGGNVSLDNFRITNLGDYEADRDALSIEGFWDLIHHPDLFVARINPEAHILGAVQQFVFDLPYSVFQIQNTFIPTNLIPSENIEEFRNSNNSGYRLVQETASPSNSGDFYLEKFLNGEEDGEKILSFEESTDQLTLEKILNANNQRIVNVTEEPAADQDTISFIYLWRVLNDEVF